MTITISVTITLLTWCRCRPDHCTARRSNRATGYSATSAACCCAADNSAGYATQGSPCQRTILFTLAAACAE